jgi:hypothetical protein
MPTEAIVRFARRRAMLRKTANLPQSVVEAERKSFVAQVEGDGWRVKFRIAMC